MRRMCRAWRECNLPGRREGPSCFVGALGLALNVERLRLARVFGRRLASGPFSTPLTVAWLGLFLLVRVADGEAGGRIALDAVGRHGIPEAVSGQGGKTVEHLRQIAGRQRHQ